MLRDPDDFVIPVGACIELIVFHEPRTEHRRWTALDLRLAGCARLTFG